MFIINNYLRKQVKLLIALQDISQKELAEYLEISSRSFWSWYNNYYQFGKEKQIRLQEIIDSLKEYDLDKLISFYDSYDFQEDEQLRPILDYYSNGRYYITNCGNVVSLCNRQWKQLAKNIDDHGYYYVTFNYEGKRIKRRTHRLVAEYFVNNPSPDENTIVHHKDLNKLNDHYSNLIFLSPEQHNRLHAELRRQENELSTLENNQGKTE